MRTGNLTCNIRIRHENFEKEKYELAANVWNLVERIFREQKKGGR